MGTLFSLFRDKPSTRDTLERIEQEIQNIEEKRWDRIKRDKLAVQILSFIPMTILITNICLLLYPSERTWRDKFLYSVPIAVINILLWACKRFIQWHSRWSQDNEEARLRKLQKEKKKILERVCENESYKVATELLEKYDPKQLRSRQNIVERAASPLNSSLTKFSASPIRSHPFSGQQSQLQHSFMQTMNQSINLPAHQNTSMILPSAPPPTPANKPAPIKPKLNASMHSAINTSLPIQNVAASSVQGRTVRPILNKDRGVLEKLVDWVVADGPDNRFALICKFCFGHNGMSLAEEFETINFRCCYCYNLNSANSRRPTQSHPETSQTNKVEAERNSSKETKAQELKETDVSLLEAERVTKLDSEEQKDADNPRERKDEEENDADEPTGLREEPGSSSK